MKDLFQKADALQQEIEQLQRKIDACEGRRDGCKAPACMSLHARRANEAKRQGNFFLVLGGLCVIAGIILTIVLYMKIEAGELNLVPEWPVGIWLWLIIPLVIGVIRKIMGMREYNDFISKHGRVEKVLADWEAYNQQQKAIEAELDALNNDQIEKMVALDDLVDYCGEEWDLSTFRGGPSAVAALEKDFKALLIALKYRGDDAEFVTNCWLGKNELRSSTATFTGDTETAEKFTRGYEALQSSGSWPLQLINATNMTLTGEIAMAALGTRGEGIPFKEALERTHVRGPENKEEQELWDLAHEVIPDLAFTVGYELRKAMGKN